MVYDAAKENHDVRDVQIKKSIMAHNLETEDHLIRHLKEFKRALLSRFLIQAQEGEQPESDTPLTEEQKKELVKALAKYRVRAVSAEEANEDVLIFFDFLQLTALTV